MLLSKSVCVCVCGISKVIAAGHTHTMVATVTPDVALSVARCRDNLHAH